MITGTPPSVETSVHDALSAAMIASTAAESVAGGSDATASLRVSEEIKAKAAEICEANGTTISMFLRKCLEGLVEDFQNPRP